MIATKLPHLQSNKQITVKNLIALKGIGLHSGTSVRINIHPAPANHGIVFLRSDLRDSPKIKADITKVCRTDMCTTLGNEGNIVATVEHLMSALAGLGVDNALIEVSAPEIPIMDGSATEFVKALLDTGFKESAAPKKVLKLKKKVTVLVGDKLVEATPCDHFEINCSINFAHSKIGEQIFTYNPETNYGTEIARSRTFGFLREVEYLHKKGLALGGSLANAVVLDDEKILNPEGLRYANEFVRHKILDAIGDFALLGIPMHASFMLSKSGHEMHAAFLRRMLEDPNAYEIIELQPVEESELKKNSSKSKNLLAAAL